MPELAGLTSRVSTSRSLIAVREARIPVDQPLVAIEQSLLGMKRRRRRAVTALAEAGVHREPLVRPVHRAPQPAQLPRDLAAAFRLPVPDLRDEVLARQVGALLPHRRHLSLDHHLRRDAGVIGAHDPQRVLALQPGVANQDVLQRIVERVPDMERPGDVWRRVDDRPWLGVRPVGVEQALPLPMRVPAAFDIGGVEGLGEFGHARRLSERMTAKPALGRCTPYTASRQFPGEGRGPARH